MTSPHLSIRPPGPTRPGFTLAEMTVSLAVVAVLLTAVGGVMVVATKALPGRSDGLADRLAVAGALQQLANDLRYACYLTEARTSAVTVTLADRDGDGQPERIRYAWSGTPGDSLTRQYNDLPPQALLDNVRNFALTFTTRTVVETYPGPLVPSAEIPFSIYKNMPDQRDFKIDKQKWPAQPFKPVLPAEAVAWRLTRFLFRAKSDGPATEHMLIQWRLADAASLPTGTVIDEQLFDEADLTGSFNSITIVPQTDQWLDINTTGCLVFAMSGSGDSCGRLRRFDNAAGFNYAKTDDAGASWRLEPDKVLWHEIYGQYATPGPDQQLARQYYTAVELTLTAGQSDAPATAADHVRLVNRPERLAALWKLDFESDPTAIDAFGDGQDDWQRRDGQPFDPASLAGGVWLADATLDTCPANDFTLPVTIEARMRNTSLGGYGAVLWINADYHNGTFAPLWVSLQLQNNGRQTLTLYRKTSDSQSIAMTRLTDLEAGFVEVRLLIDPQRDTVNLRVNGIDQGTYPYSTYSPGLVQLNQKQLSLLPWGSSAEFDSVTVRVGGNWP